MSWALRVGHHDRVGFGVSRRTGAGLAAVVFAAGAGVQAALSTDPPGWLAFGLVLLSVPVLTGLLIAWRAPGSLVGPVLCWVGAAPSAVFALELWGETVDRPHPWPGAGAVHAVAVGAWVWNLAGFAALCLVFPTGLRPGRRWRVVAGAAGAAGVAVNALASWATLDTARFDGLPVPAQVAVVVPAYAALLAALGACVAALVARHRDGDRRTRQQIRWLALGAGTVPVLLAAGWALQAAGAPTTVAYPAFLVAMLVAVPAAVAVAVLRHDLLDVDRLLGASLAWLLTSVVSAAIFAAIVVGAAELFGHAGASGVVGAAFVTALCLLPLHRRLHDAVGRVVDRERYVIAGRAQQFVREVRDGTREPEGAEALLRDLLADP
ncbi:MAG TPA: hypothetical protein VHA75_01625, partial [Rugosimonospora sp.]|nr:hypothetical protein [Rugosimonospora sp.]